MRFNPDSLNNHVALKTSWAPLVVGGRMFSRHVVKKISKRRLEFKVNTKEALRPNLIDLLILLFSLITIISGVYGDNYNLVYVSIPFLGLFLYNFISSIVSLKNGKIFDMNVGYFWDGKNKTTRIDIEDSKEFCKLSQIEAVQLISESCHHGMGDNIKDYYFSYEMNLVLKDGERINIVDYSDLDTVRKNGNNLASFLNVYLWDAIQDYKIKEKE